MGRAGGGGGEVVEHEVAIGDGVDRVRRDRGEAELGGQQPAVGVEVHAGQRARAERQLLGRAEHELEAPGVAAEHPEVGEQVVREVDGLGALEVRVAGHRPVEVALGEVDQRRLQRAQAVERAERVRAREQREVGRHLVVARARGMQLVPDRARRSRSAAARPPCGCRRRRARTGSCRPRARGRPGRARAAARRARVGNDPRRREHQRVRTRLRDVVGPEPPVEADRGVEPLEDGIGRLGEARHTRA